MDEDSNVTQHQPRDLFGSVWGTGNNDSAEMVKSKFDSTEDLADMYSGRVLGLFEQLVGLIEEYAPDPGHIDYDYIEAPPVPAIGMVAPEAPVTIKPEIGTPPSMRGEIQGISLEAPEKPTDTVISDPAPAFNYEEIPYVSELLGNLQNSINDVVLNGGRGLPDDVFQDTLDLALTQDELEYEKAYRDAENYFASKGHDVPPGALVSRINMLMRERTRNQQRITTELTNKQAELAYQQEQFMAEIGVKLETITMDQKDKVANRAYQLAKDHVVFFYTAVDNSIKYYQARLDAYKTEWAAEETKVNAIASANKNITDTFIAENEAYKTGILTELSIIEQITKVYVAEMSGYETAIKAETLKSNALIERYRAQIEESKNKAQLSATNAELILRAAIAKWDANKDAMKSMTSVAGQITASALSAVNASASISSGASFSNSYNSSKSLSQSNSGNESVSISKNYSYSA